MRVKGLKIGSFAFQLPYPKLCSNALFKHNFFLEGFFMRSTNVFWCRFWFFRLYGSLYDVVIYHNRRVRQLNAIPSNKFYLISFEGVAVYFTAFVHS